eukprot:954701-Prymnesium_polylepis.1
MPCCWCICICIWTRPGWICIPMYAGYPCARHATRAAVGQDPVWPTRRSEGAPGVSPPHLLHIVLTPVGAVGLLAPVARLSPPVARCVGPAYHQRLRRFGQ